VTADEIVYLEVFVEEPSAQALLRHLLPKILPPRVSYEIRVFNGKPDLLRKLPNRLRGYRLQPHRIVTLIDNDDGDCLKLKGQLEAMAEEAGFTTKSRSEGLAFRVVNRIAVQELESWLLGDVQALRSVYPRVPPTLANRRRFRDPDAALGGTAEALARVLADAGYHSQGLPKMEVANAVGEHLEPERNRSASFRCFCDGVRAVVDSRG
jgi:hypothetical protein